MNIKTGKILDALGKRARYEDKHYEKIPHEKRMLAITADTGIFYNSLIRATKTKRILEIGLSVGYSTIWFAEALPDNGKIISIEQNPDKIKRAKQNFVQAGVSKKIKIRQGNAKQVLQEMLSEFRKKRTLFDFVFIDAD
ncbi:MAG: O-methyltransferase, partial [Candidatus Nitrosotenuis sp.]